MNAITGRADVSDMKAIAARIERETERRLSALAAQPDRIAARLADLDREWDIERALQAGVAAFATFGALKTLTRGGLWTLVPVLMGGSLVQQAVIGWSLPLPFLRGLGFRTVAEIQRERSALLSLARTRTVGGAT